MVSKIVLTVLGVIFIINLVQCEDSQRNRAEFGRELVEQGRTFVHHAIKRMAIIMPLIFFKLGVAFTLLLLVTVVSVNNGIIGFMLLVVGLSSVLARLQEARTPAVQHLPHLAYASPHYGHFLDRSDDVRDTQMVKTYSQMMTPNPYTNIVYGRYT